MLARHSGFRTAQTAQGRQLQQERLERRKSFGKEDTFSRLGSAEQHAMLSRSVAQSTRSEQHCHLACAFPATGLSSMVPPSRGIIDHVRVMAVVAHLQRSEPVVVRERAQLEVKEYRCTDAAFFTAAYSGAPQ